MDYGLQNNSKNLRVPLDDVVMDSPLCTQTDRGLWTSLLHDQDILPSSQINVQENTPEEPKEILLKPHGEEKLASTAEVLIEKDKVLFKGEKSKMWEIGMNEHSSIVGQAGREEFSVAVSNTETNSWDQSNANERRNDSSLIVPDDEKKVEDEEFIVNESSTEKVQTCDLGTVELSCDPTTKSVHIKQKSKESINVAVKQETDAEADKGEAKRSYVFGYFAGKLSEAYRDAGRKLQGTRDIIRNIQVAEIKVLLSQYVTMMSKELPLMHRLQLKSEPEALAPAANRVHLMDLSRDRSLSPRQNFTMSALPGVSRWPEGSVASLRNMRPEVFYQGLVQLPTALSQLQTFSSQKMIERFESLAPQMQVGKLLNVFWLKTADGNQPLPKPGCLLLMEKDVVVVSTAAYSDDIIAVSHHFNLVKIRKIQISLAGQHVRLIGCTEDIILVAFTHSKELTQDLCKALLKALAPERSSEWTEGHPLLSGDLMSLSLDWKAIVPDITLDNGLQVTSRFKRVLADLLYIVHGNMGGPDKPSLANVCPLLYTSVKLKNSTNVRQDPIFQFLLTDTHVALLQEDGVFHPVPRGSGLVPVQPQFQGLELHRRSDIKCVFVRQSENCLVVDIAFMSKKAGDAVDFRLCSAEVPYASDYQCDSWKLCFGCTSEAVILIHHLCA